MLAVAAAVGIVLFGVLACGSSSNTTAPATSLSAATTPKPATTELTTTTATSVPVSASIPVTAVTTDSGPVLIVDVAIGGKTLNVLLDTGSYGLRLVASQVPPDAVRRTGPAPQFSYATGVKVSGDLAQASAQIGGQQTAGPIPIELVTDTSCDPGRPDCPAANGKKPIMFGGRFDGIMGVSMRAVEGLVNPLWRLPDGLGHEFAVHYDPAGASTVLLGEPEAGYNLVQLDKGTPTNVPDAPPPWIPSMPVCFTEAALPGGQTCGATAFDTGTTTIQIVAPDAHNSDVPAGTAIEMSVGQGAFSHTYTTGPGARAEIIASSPSRSQSIAGLPSYAAADVRYDLVAGTIGFRPR
jgi:hypothetical protein